VLRVRDRVEASHDHAAHGSTRQSVTACQAVPEIERQHRFPPGYGFPMIAGPGMLFQDARDQRAELLACAGRHFSQKGDHAILAPGKPRLEVKVPFHDGIDQQTGGRRKVGRRQDAVGGNGRRARGDVARTAFQQLAL
jgi:hypothetical protein